MQFPVCTDMDDSVQALADHSDLQCYMYAGLWAKVSQGGCANSGVQSLVHTCYTWQAH